MPGYCTVITVLAGSKNLVLCHSIRLYWETDRRRVFHQPGQPLANSSRGLDRSNLLLSYVPYRMSWQYKQARVTARIFSREPCSATYKVAAQRPRSSWKIARISGATRLIHRLARLPASAFWLLHISPVPQILTCRWPPEIHLSSGLWKRISPVLRGIYKAPAARSSKPRPGPPTWSLIGTRLCKVLLMWNQPCLAAHPVSPWTHHRLVRSGRLVQHWDSRHRLSYVAGRSRHEWI